jgi:hypothetical protein
MLNKNVLLLTGVMALSLALTGCSSINKEQLASGLMVAQVEGTPISRTDFDAEVNRLTRQFLLANQLPEDTDLAEDPNLTRELQTDAMGRLVMQTFLRNDARRYNVRVTEGELQKFKDELFANDPNFENEHKAFLNNASAEADFNRQLRDQLLFNKLMLKLGRKQLRIPPESELKRYYLGHRMEFFVPATVTYEPIFIKTSDHDLSTAMEAHGQQVSDEQMQVMVSKARKEAKQKAENVYRQVRQNPDRFQEVSDKNGTALTSGNPNSAEFRLTEEQIAPEIWAVLKSLDPGDLYPGVLESQDGYLVLRVKSVEPLRYRPFSEVRYNIIARLMDQTQRELVNEWMKSNSERMDNDDVLKITPSLEYIRESVVQSGPGASQG